MLEVRNLVKVYKPKKGKPVKALNGVSIKFPEKGLVFILGKSGCGKSTLLNMMGGLDRVDSGEIIIKGKSSKDFSQADFDSYRNTYLGFIFQEYNILNEFTVGANVGLALELQGKKATKEAINEILAQVEMEDYASRKPMQLSGGQKQRIAIARALVKNPEIILADEPTGALDSKTGIQVFDTLKELAKTKLVIVVSHDREFAESYGDRVIELKDGEVISDIEKYVAESEKKNESISVIDEKIIQIKKGYELTKEDIQMINAYLKYNDAILSVDETSNKDLKKFARIDDSGNKECFKDTNEDEIVYEKKQKFKLIKSRLPFKDSFKIGASGLKAKPVRLVISIILSFVAFTLFGLADTINAYNKYTTTVNSLIDSDVQNISFVKENVIDNGSYTSESIVNLTDEDVALLKQKTGLTYNGVYAPKDSIGLNSNAIESLNDYGGLYMNSLKGFIENDSASFAELGLTMMAGRYPTDTNEVAISDYVYKSLQSSGYKSSDGTIRIKNTEMKNMTPTQFLNSEFTPTLCLNNVDYKIVGIIDTKLNYDHFAALAQESTGTSGAIMNYILLQELQSTVFYGYHSQVFVAKGFIDANYSGETEIVIRLNGNPYINLSYNSKEVGKSGFYAYAVLSKGTLDDNNLPYVTFEQMGDKDFMISMKSLKQALRNYYQNETGDWDEDSWTGAPQWIKDKAINEIYNEMSYKFYKQLHDKAIAAGYTYGHWDWNDTLQKYEWVNDNPTTEEDKVQNVYEYLSNYTYRSGEESLPNWVTTSQGTYIEQTWRFDTYIRAEAEYKVMSDAIKNTSITLPSEMETSYVRNYSNEATRSYDYDSTGKMVGVYLQPYQEPSPNGGYDSSSLNYENVLVVANSVYNDVADAKGGKYVFAITKMVAESQLKNIVKWSYDNSAAKSDKISTHYIIKAGPTELLGMVNDTLESLTQVFMWVGLGLALFAALLMMNYIATTISYKKREIGILRAVGARSVDVFGIFFNESLIIAFINFILASVSTFGFVFYINTALRDKYNLTLTLLNFSFRQVAFILLIAVGVAALASALPVFNISRKKPIDAIRSE